ncbi:MAG: phosphate acyltransferase PlsX [Pseudomonadota bacterium]
MKKPSQQALNPIELPIAIDAMGGDCGPEVTVPAALDALQADPRLSLFLVGLPDLIEPHIKIYPRADALRARFHIIPAPEVVTMDDLPAVALRNKRQSSMRLALDLVKEGRASACVSAGNTGALMAISRYVLKMMPGVDRPALMYRLPTIHNPHGFFRILDLGANIECTAVQLVQFAVMGAVVSESMDGIVRPRVGLLNIGTEAMKGTEAIRDAAALLSAQSAINYTGFVEGNYIYQDVVDVVVCDGFVGNITLKVSEGVVTLLLEAIRSEFMRTPFRRFVAWLARPVFRAVKKQFSPEQHNGAPLLGLEGVVVKSHGGAQRRAFEVAIHEAALQVTHQVPLRIRSLLAELLSIKNESH